MRIAFFSYGTRGDVQPHLGLAASLVEQGHSVVVCAPENLRRFVESAGLPYAPLQGNSQEILDSEEGKRMLSEGDIRSFLKAMGEMGPKIWPPVFRDMLQAAQGADLIVGTTFCEDSAPTIAEHLKLPYILIRTMPIDRTSDLPHPLVTAARLPRFLNSVTHWLFDKMYWASLQHLLNPFRASLGLPPRQHTVAFETPTNGGPVIELFSEHVVQRRSDKPSHVVTAGYQRLPASVRAKMGESAPPAGLEAWLANGPPPIYLGFGSMPVRDPVAHTRMALGAAKELGMRVILAAGWTDLSAVHDQQSDQVFFVKTVDHGWLFPKCAAVVHHGGAGTAAASLESGVPTVICSVFADQPYWGSRVVRLGVGAHVPYAKLDQARLTKALRVALQDETKKRASALGEKLRAEDGNAAALREFAKHLGAIEKAA